MGTTVFDTICDVVNDWFVVATLRCQSFNDNSWFDDGMSTAIPGVSYEPRISLQASACKSDGSTIQHC